MDIRRYLSGKGVTWKREISGKQGTKEIIINCPNCGKPRFYINLDTGMYDCKHMNNCGISGNFYKLQQLFGDRPQRAYESNVQSVSYKNYKKPKVEIKKTDKAAEFLSKRMIKSEIVEQYKIGFDEKSQAIIFPYYRDKKLEFVKYRSVKEKKFWREKDAAPILFGMDNVESHNLIIVEGEIDCLSIKQYFNDMGVVSVPSGVSDNTWIELCWEWLEQFDKIYLGLDNDEAGADAINKIAHRLGKWRCYEVKWSMKDANECLINGVDRRTMFDCILKARDFYHNKIKSSLEYKDEMKSDNRVSRKGASTGIRQLDNILRGWRSKEWTVWTGNNGSGKTTFLNQVVNNNLKNDRKQCMLSLELPIRNLLNWLIMNYTGLEIYSDMQSDDFFDSVGNNLYFMNKSGHIEVAELLELMETAVRKYGIDDFFIDNMAGISFDERNMNDEQRKFAISIDAFAKDYDCHVHIVIHPRKGLNDERRPDKVDVMGSGHLTNLAWNVILVHRLSEKEKKKTYADAVAEVMKNREWGTLEDIYFNFYEESKRFVETTLDEKIEACRDIFND